MTHLAALMLASVLVSPSIAAAETGMAIKGEIVVSRASSEAPERPSVPAAAAEIRAPALSPPSPKAAPLASAAASSIAAPPALRTSPTPAPAPAPLPPVAFAVAGGEALRDVLDRWARKEGWQVVWDASMTYELRAGAAFSTGLLDSVEQISKIVWRDHAALRVDAYKGNRLIHVWEEGL